MPAFWGPWGGGLLVSVKEGQHAVPPALPVWASQWELKFTDHSSHRQRTATVSVAVLPNACTA